MGAAIVGGLLVFRGCPRQPDRRFSVTGWGAGATLLLRRDGDGLLFAPGVRYLEPPVGAPREEAYRLDGSRRQLSPVPRSVWEGAGGAVVDCQRFGFDPRVQLVGGSLRLNGRMVSGEPNVSQARLSPDGRSVAALVRRGVTVPTLSVIPALGGPRTIGWRFHQLYSMASGEPMGGPALLHFGVEDPLPCWSPDGAAVIYANHEFSELALLLSDGR